MADRIRVRPTARADGAGEGLRLVGFPGRPGAHLADAGEDVPETAYWLRRLRAGDVERCAAARTSSSTKGKTPAKKPTPPAEE